MDDLSSRRSWWDGGLRRAATRAQRWQMTRKLMRSKGILLGLASVVLAVLCLAQTAPNYTITTVAGTGASKYPAEEGEEEKTGVGDDGLATEAILFSPFGVLLDGEGNLYIADQLNHRVRKVAPDGTITTVAGNGTAGSVGDGEAATAAALNDPCGLAMDSSGNLYIADTGNSVIRKVTPTGTITKVAGTYTAGYSGDYDPDKTDEDNGKATLAQLSHPIGLAFDAAGNLYIADTSNNRIRKVDTNGIITTVAGNGSTGSLGDGGKATDAPLYNPEGVALDGAGNLYIADTNNGMVRKVSADGIITTVAGTGMFGYSGDGGPAAAASLNYPKSIALDGSGNMFIVDSYNSRLRMVASDGTIHTIAGDGRFGDQGDGGPATRARLRFPSALALDAAGRIYFSDTQNNRIRLLTPVTPSGPAAAPVINAGGVVSASDFGAFPEVAPGSWIEIHGSNLAAASRGWTAADFNGSQAPTTLGGTRVKIGGMDAFLAYVSPTRVDAQLPSGLGAGSQQLTVTTAAGASAPYRITVNPTQPGLYAPQAFKIDGRQYVGAVSADGASFILPSGSAAGVPSRPARPGETIVLYGIGFGPVSPGTGAGELARQASTVAAPVQAFFGGVQAEVTYQGLAPGTVGLYQVNVVVPDVPASDAVPLSFSVGGVTGSQQLYTAVQ
jgi:uncharacterized protein (TIGR03437 family)